MKKGFTPKQKPQNKRKEQSMRHPISNTEKANWPQPGDYCQWDEYDAEVLSCDGNVVEINVFIDGDGDDYETRTLNYIPSDW